MSYGTDFQKRLFYSLPIVVKNIFTSGYGLTQKKMRHGKTYKKYFDLLNANQYLHDESIKEFQQEELFYFFNNSLQYSPYFKKIFSQTGFNIHSDNYDTEVKKLPILTKDEYRTHFMEIRCSNYADSDLHWLHTSGTTGLGLQLAETWNCFEREYAFRFQNYYSGGAIVGHKWAFCAGHPVTSPQRKKPPFWSQDYTNKWLLMSSYNMTEDNLKYYIEKLSRYEPEMLGGYPSSIYLLALANEYYGQKIHPKVIYTASETLFDYQKTVIKKSFGCNVLTYYGNSERAGFLVECEKGSIHAKNEHSFIEILDENDNPVADDEAGNLICTAFGNHATPLIRYFVGDKLIKSKKRICECGRNGLLIKEIQGRDEDYILTPDGRFVGRLDHIFKDAKNVRAAQIIQNTIDTIILKIVKDRNYNSEEESGILMEGRRRLGNSLKINFLYVNEIERTKNGKHKFILSTIDRKKIFKKQVSI